jgi:hypothetical protein
LEIEKKDTNSRVTNYMIKLGAQFVSSRSVEHMLVSYFLFPNHEITFGQKFEFFKDSFMNYCDCDIQNSTVIPSITREASSNCKNIIKQNRCPKTAFPNCWSLIVQHLMKDKTLCIPFSKSSRSPTFVIHFEVELLLLCISIKLKEEIGIQELCEEISKSPFIKFKDQKFKLKSEYNVTFVLIALKFKKDLTELIPVSAKYKTFRNAVGEYKIPQNLEVIVIRDVGDIFCDLNIQKLQEKSIDGVVDNNMLMEIMMENRFK